MQLQDLKVLYIDDEDFIRQAAKSYLSFYCQEVFEAKDGEEGYALYKTCKPDVIITDIKMPKLNGLEMVKRIRKEDKSTKILVATAFLESSYLLQAVELGLVKYLVKPITEAELMPVLKECTQELIQKSNIVNLAHNLRYDSFNKTLFKGNEQLYLPKKEALLLELLVKHHQRAVRYEEIAAFVWEGDMSDYALRSAVRDLRHRLCKTSIKNISGVGYQLVLC